MRWPRLLVLCPLLAAGCTMYRAPRVEVTGVSLGDRGPEAVQLVFDVRIANPNARTIELEELAYTLSVDGRRVFEGRRAAGRNLASAGEQQIKVPAVIPAAAVEDASRCALRGSLRYRTPGQLAQRLFDTGVRRPRTRFRYEGPVALD